MPPLLRRRLGRAGEQERPVRSMHQLPGVRLQASQEKAREESSVYRQSIRQKKVPRVAGLKTRRLKARRLGRAGELELLQPSISIHCHPFIPWRLFSALSGGLVILLPCHEEGAGKISLNHGV